MSSGFRRQALTSLIVVTAALSAASAAHAAPGAVSSKEAQARDVLAQIQGLDGSLERAIEAYNLATDKLHAIEGDLRENLHELKSPRRTWAARRRRSRSAGELYTSGGGHDTASRSSSAPTHGRHAQPDRDDQPRLGPERGHQPPDHEFGAVKEHRIELKNAHGSRRSSSRSVPTRRRRSSRSCHRASSWSPRSERDRADEAGRRSVRPSSRPGAERGRRERPRRSSLPRAGARTAGYRSSPVTPPPPARNGGVVGSRCATSGSRTSTPGEPGRVRLLRASRCTSTRKSASRSRTTRPCSSGRGHRSRATARARRPRVLLRARPRRDVHRRRQLHPRAAHRRRGQDLTACRAVRLRLRRRPRATPT